MTDKNDDLSKPKGGGDIEGFEPDESKLDDDLKAAVEANIQANLKPDGEKSEDEKAAEAKAVEEAAAKKKAEEDAAKTDEEKAAEAKAVEEAAAKKKAEEDDLETLDAGKGAKKKVEKTDAEKEAERKAAEENVEGLLDDKPPEALSEESAKDWDSLKEKANTKISGHMEAIKDLTQKNVDLSEKLDKNQDSEKMESLTKQNEDLQSRLEKVDLKNSPAFKEKYTNQKEAMIKGLEKHFKDHNVDESVTELLKLSGAELSAKVDEINEKLPGMAKQDTIDTIRSYQQLVAQEDEALTNAAVANTMLNAKMDGDIEKSFKLSFDGLKNEAGRMLDIQDIPQDATPERRKFLEDSNASVEGMEEVAKKIASGDMTQDEINQVAVVYAWGLHNFEFTMPDVSAKFNALVVKVQSYKKEMDEIIAMNPDLAADLSQKTPEEVAKAKAKATEDDPYSSSEFEASVKENITDNLTK